MDGVGLPEGMTEVVEKATGSSEQPVCRVDWSRRLMQEGDVGEVDQS